MSTADLAKQAGMSEAQWKEAIKFDSTDRGWIIMSIGMAIGAGIVFLPVQVGLVGFYCPHLLLILLFICYNGYSSIPWRTRRTVMIIPVLSAVI